MGNNISTLLLENDNKTYDLKYMFQHFHNSGQKQHYFIYHRTHGDKTDATLVLFSINRNQGFSGTKSLANSRKKLIWV